MVTLFIGDVHGRDLWKQAIESEHDRVVFVGDYFDSYDIPFSIQQYNFNEIIQFKRANPNKVTLLLGNHDMNLYVKSHIT